MKFSDLAYDPSFQLSADVRSTLAGVFPENQLAEAELMAKYILGNTWNLGAGQLLDSLLYLAQGNLEAVSGYFPIHDPRDVVEAAHARQKRVRAEEEAIKLRLHGRGANIVQQAPVPTPKNETAVEKMQRLRNSHPAHGIKGGDEFEEAEVRLNVLFHPYFKELYRRKQGEKLGPFALMQIRHFFTCNEFTEFEPATYHSVAVAEDGIGNFLVCCLEPDSDYQLEDGMVAVDHETGEVDPW